MSSMLKVNGSDSVNYLIHGQDLTLEFEFPEAFFVLIKYNPVPATEKFRKGSFWWFQRLHWFKRKGLFQSKVNVFHPQLTLFIFGWGIKKISVPLKVEHVHLKNKLPAIQLPMLKKELPRIPLVQMAGYQKVEYPRFKEFTQLKNIQVIPSIQLPWNQLEQRLIENKIK